MKQYFLSMEIHMKLIHTTYTQTWMIKILIIMRYYEHLHHETLQNLADSCRFEKIFI